MSYPPNIHQDNNKQHLVEVITTYPLATVISVNDNQPLITHLPLIFSDDDTLIGHIDANNPQAELLKDNKNVTIIFSGPDCYISPSIYKTSQLPTWNYVKVHLKGTVTEITDLEDIKQSMIALTEFLEPNNAYVLEPNNPKMTQYLPYVKGFKIDITHWEGKFKLSQNRNATDFELAKQELIRKNQESIKMFLKAINNNL
jgi:transcriptional regulator